MTDYEHLDYGDFRMKLSQLIEKLELLKKDHGEIEVEFMIPAYENSYESDYVATKLSESEVFDSILPEPLLVLTLS